MVQAATADVVVRSRKKGEKIYADVQAQLDRLNSRVKQLGLFAGAAAVGGLAALTVKSFESADALAKSAEKIGVGTQKLASLNRLAVMAGGSVGGMQEALTKATKRLGEFNATGGGAAGVWLERLNLDTKELATLSPDQLFERYSEAIGGLNNRGEKLAAISALMGDESRSLIGLVDQGSAAFAESQAEVERYALALNGVDSAKVEAANDAMFKARERAAGIGNIIASKVAPIVTALANRFIETGAEADAMGETVDRVIDGIALGAGLVGDAFFGWKLIFAAVRVEVLQGSANIVAAFARIEQAGTAVNNSIRGIVGAQQFDPENGPLRKVELSLDASAAHAKEILQELAASEKPSIALGRALAQARIEAEETAKATAKAREKLQEIAAPTFDESNKEEKAREREEAAAQRLKDQLATKLATIETSLLTETDREIEAHERRQEILQSALDNELVTKERAFEIEAQLQEQHEARLNKITLKGLSDRQKFEAKSGKDKTKQIFGELANITAGVATHNKTLFRINQAAAIANAIISTHEGVARTLGTYPWPLSGILAAAHLAAGIAQVSAIRSASPGGGTTPSLAGSTPTFNDQPVSTVGQPGIGSGGSAQPPAQITIIVEGSLVGDEGIKQLLTDTIGELVDADEILINPSSRQAVEIREGTGTGG